MSSAPIRQRHESVEEASVSNLGACGCVSGHAFRQVPFLDQILVFSILNWGKIGIQDLESRPQV